MNLKNLIANWKTTSAGLAMVVGGVVHFIFAFHAHSLTEADCTTTVLAIITGAGFIAAGDADAAPPVNPPPPPAQSVP